MRRIHLLLAFFLLHPALQAQTCPVPATHAAVPKMDGLKYAVARKTLMAKGWQPLQTHKDATPFEISMGNGPTFWKKGFREVQHCYPTGTGACTFLFKDQIGNQLRVFTTGEEDPAGGYSASVDGHAWDCDDKLFTRAELLEVLRSQATSSDKDEKVVNECLASAMVEAAFSGTQGGGARESELMRRLGTFDPQRSGFACLRKVAKVVDLDEFRVDHAQYRSQRVLVSALGQYIMGNLVLKRSPTDLSPVAVDMTAVNREQRLEIVKNCSDAGRPCKLYVTGFAGSVASIPGIIARAVFLQVAVR